MRNGGNANANAQRSRRRRGALYATTHAASVRLKFELEGEGLNLKP
jgi:hypothetical protein